MKFRPRGLMRRWRLGKVAQRHPFDRGFISEWEQELILYWLRNTSHRRHREPYAKTMRGAQRRALRRFRLIEKKGATTMNQLSALSALALPNVKIVEERFPIAQTSYKCTVCGLPIHSGSQYWRLVYRDRDARDRRKNMRTSRIHLRCPDGEASMAKRSEVQP